MNTLIRRILTPALKANIYKYGDIKYTQDLIAQSDFPHVTAYRAYDLDGKLLDTKVKYDVDELNKILKSMIYID